MIGRVAGSAALAVALAAGSTGAAVHAAPKGKPKWRAQQGPGPRLVGSLNQVEFAGDQHGWAAGVEGPDNDLALWKWNGGKWKRAKAGWRFAPAGLAVSGPKKAWLTGVTLSAAHALHYNGRKWREVAFPGPGAPVDLAAAPDGTAVSVARHVFDGVNTVQRWKDGRWRPMKVPLPSGASLATVAVASKKDIWLGGGRRVGEDEVEPLLMRWNGRSWKRIALKGAADKAVTKIIADGDGKAWALRGSTETTLLRWDGERVRERRLPGGVGALTLTHDGAGGVWVLPYSRSDAKAAPYLLWSKGRWKSFTGPRRNGVVGLGDLDLIPGTSRVVSVGGLQQKEPKERKFPMLEMFS
ncbi:hypothetical protein [Actinocorallia populi]|uniref:hypothetical protein n=1 Tax=Actinocorallia populi TaxID=2079200 RepID=UPI000D09308B|nr:hypothetical protein [Actinocorallia populi]